MKNVIRVCRSCKTKKNREDLIKITISDNQIFINPNSKTTGRSVYVCENPECIKTLIKIKGIKRGLKTNDEAAIKKTENLLNELIQAKHPADKLR